MNAPSCIGLVLLPQIEDLLQLNSVRGLALPLVQLKLPEMRVQTSVIISFNKKVYTLN